MVLEMSYTFLMCESRKDNIEIKWMHPTTGKEPEKNQKASKPQKKNKNSLFIVAEMYCFI